jgi:hypothetical protein
VLRQSARPLLLAAAVDRCLNFGPDQRVLYVAQTEPRA